MSKYKDGITGKERYGKAVSKPRTAAEGIYQRSKELPFIETAKDAIEKKDATAIELEKINHNVLFTIERVNEIYLSVKESDKRRLRRKEILEWVGFFMKTAILIVLTANFLVSLYTKWIPEVFSIW